MLPKAPSGEMGEGVAIDRMRKCSPRRNYNNYGFYVLRNGVGFTRLSPEIRQTCQVI